MVPSEEDQAQCPEGAHMTVPTTTKFDTTPVRAGFSFDESGLARWMKANVVGFSGPPKVEQFNGGQSNPTYMLTTLEKAYVLWRKPSGTLLKGAHAIGREVRVLSALERANFRYRTSTVYA